MVTLATDDFNRADEALDASADWTASFGVSFQITSNVAHPNENSGETQIVYTGITWPDDQWSRCTLSAVGNGIYAGPCVRGSDSEHTCYGIYSDSADAKYCIEWNNDSPTFHQSSGNTYSATDLVEMQASGSDMDVLLNGSADPDFTTLSDATIGSGDAGMLGYDDGSGTACDDWEGGDFTAGLNPGAFLRRYEHMPAPNPLLRM